MKVLVIDINKCNGCYNCQVACKDEHVDNDWTPIAKPQPDTGHFWMKVTDVVQGTVPKVRVRYMLDTCQHCDDAPCIPACSSEAIYKREDGIVIIDPEKCTGNRDLHRGLPVRRHLLQLRSQHLSEMHHVRAPSGRAAGRSPAAWTPVPPAH